MRGRPTPSPWPRVRAIGSDRWRRRTAGWTQSRPRTWWTRARCGWCATPRPRQTRYRRVGNSDCENDFSWPYFWKAGKSLKTLQLEKESWNVIWMDKCLWKQKFILDGHFLVFIREMEYLQQTTDSFLPPTNVWLSDIKHITSGHFLNHVTNVWNCRLKTVGLIGITVFLSTVRLGLTKGWGFTLSISVQTPSNWGRSAVTQN